MSTSCPHCGAAMDDGSRFSVCGRPIPAMVRKQLFCSQTRHCRVWKKQTSAYRPRRVSACSYRAARKNARSCGIWRLRKVRLRGLY